MGHEVEEASEGILLLINKKLQYNILTIYKQYIFIELTIRAFFFIGYFYLHSEFEMNELFHDLVLSFPIVFDNIMCEKVLIAGW